MNGPFFILEIILIIGFPIGVIILLYYLFFKPKKGLDQKTGDPITDYNQIIHDAQAKAREIIEQAGSQAATIVTQTESAKLDINREEKEVFKKITDEQMQLLHTNTETYFTEYQASLQDVKNHYAEELNKIISNMQAATEKEMQELKELLKSQVTSSEGASAKQIQDDFAKAQIEIAEYKKHQLAKIDESINDVLLKVSGSILGKVIPVRDHQQIIIDALEQAKKEGMFQI